MQCSKLGSLLDHLVSEKRILSHLRKGTGILKTAELVGVGTGTVQRIKAAMSGPFDASAGVEMFSTI
jgi:hypothetical protein